MSSRVQLGLLRWQGDSAATAAGTAALHRERFDRTGQIILAFRVGEPSDSSDQSFEEAIDLLFCVESPQTHPN